MAHEQAASPVWVKFLNLNALLVFLPVAIVLRLSGGSDMAIFATSALAIVPLAGLIGRARQKRSRHGPAHKWAGCSTRRWAMLPS